MTATAPLPLSYSTPQTSAAPQRLKSLDVFRGITLAMMLLVNNPGSSEHKYAPLEHADWNGCTPTDLVFPFFMFIVGVAIPFSAASRRRKAIEAGASPSEANARLAWNVLRRGLMIIAVGLLIHLTPSSPTNGFLNLPHLRLFGVLQRIGLCYIPAGLLALWLGWRSRSAAIVLLLVTYSLLMFLVPVPGFGRGDLSAHGNFAAWLDRTLLPNHIYKPHYDPEGLVSSLPAICTILLGTLAGDWLRRTDRSPIEKSAGLFVGGVLAAAIGYILNGALMPINKALWTPSYTFYTAGLALLGLGLCHWLIDVNRRERGSTFFIVFGVNPILAFVLSAIVNRILMLTRWHGADGKTITLRGWLYSFIEPLASPINASLIWAIAYVLFFWAILYVMYRKRIYIKI